MKPNPDELLSGSYVKSVLISRTGLNIVTWTVTALTVKSNWLMKAIFSRGREGGDSDAPHHQCIMIIVSCCLWYQMSLVTDVCSSRWSQVYWSWAPHTLLIMNSWCRCSVSTHWLSVATLPALRLERIINIADQEKQLDQRWDTGGGGTDWSW